VASVEGCGGEDPLWGKRLGPNATDIEQAAHMGNQANIQEGCLLSEVSIENI
jgi:hypothetical protein